MINNAALDKISECNMIADFQRGTFRREICAVTSLRDFGSAFLFFEDVRLNLKPFRLTDMREKITQENHLKAMLP